MGTTGCTLTYWERSICRRCERRGWWGSWARCMLAGKTGTSCTPAISDAEIFDILEILPAELGLLDADDVGLEFIKKLGQRASPP